MDKRQMLDTPDVESQDVLTDEESTLQRQIAALQHQNAALQRQNAAMREDNDDLRASALWWKALYEDAQRRSDELDDDASSVPSRTRVAGAISVMQIENEM
jgi:hypothetical protein